MHGGRIPVLGIEFGASSGEHCGLHSSWVFLPLTQNVGRNIRLQRICIARVAFWEWSRRKRGGGLVVLVPCISDVAFTFELRCFARSSALVACVWEMPWSVVVLTDRLYSFPQFLKPNAGIVYEIRGWYIGIWDDSGCFVMWQLACFVEILLCNRWNRESKSIHDIPKRREQLIRLIQRHGVAFRKTLVPHA
jgi:hypothetical protein